MSLLLMGAGKAVDAAAAFDPLTLSPAAWWKADSLALSDGAAISSWTDSSGNGRTQTQTGAARPLYKAAIQNGLPVVRFDGVDDYMMTFGVSFAHKHAFVVAKYNAATFPAFNGLLTGESAQLVLIGSGSSALFYDDTGATTTYHLNGTSYAESAMAAPMNAFGVCSISNSAGWPAERIMLGDDRGLAGRYWNGDIAEILLFSTVLSSGNRASVQAYLKAKWGTP